MDLNVEFFYNDGGWTEQDGMRHVKTLQWLSVVPCTGGHYTVSVDGSPAELIPAGSCFIAPSGVLQDIVHHTYSGSFSSRYMFIDSRFRDMSRLEERYAFPVKLPA